MKNLDSAEAVKKFAQNLSKNLKTEASYHQILDAVSRSCGHKDWNSLLAFEKARTTKMPYNIIINASDAKGEWSWLARKAVSSVYYFNGAALDAESGLLIPKEHLSMTDSEIIKKTDKGVPVTNKNGMIQTKPIIYPSFNPIDSVFLPHDANDRHLFMQELMRGWLKNIDSQKDKFWMDKSIELIIYHIQIYIAQCELSEITPSLPDFFCDYLIKKWKLMDTEDFDRSILLKNWDETEKLHNLYKERFGFSIFGRAHTQLGAGLLTMPDKTSRVIMEDALNASGINELFSLHQTLSFNTLSYQALFGDSNTTIYLEDNPTQRSCMVFNTLFYSFVNAIMSRPEEIVKKVKNPGGLFSLENKLINPDELDDFRNKLTISQLSSFTGGGTLGVVNPVSVK